MNRLSKQNLHNIRCVFEEKTGTDLNPNHREHPKNRAKYLILAAVLCALLLASCTQTLFTPLSGDELALSGTYLGDGVVRVEVVNRSDKELKFQNQVKLMSWTDGEVEALPGGTVTLDNTRFPAHSGGTMTVDLSGAYDIAALESDLPGRPAESWYYLLLTNHDFLFGHDWMCSFHFVESAEVMEPTSELQQATVPTQETQPELGTNVPQNLDEIEDDLKPYFEDTYLDEAPAFEQAHFAYQQKVRELLMRTEGTLVHPVDPYITIEPSRDQVFDETFPKDIQYQLAGLNYHSLDAFHRIVGAEFSGETSDHSLQIKAMLPGYPGQTDGGQYLPIVYLFVYERASLAAEDAYAFIFGRIIPFPDMEKDKVFEDDRYVIYDMTDLFYTDLDSYIDAFVSSMQGKVSLYFDEQIRRRVHNLYDYFRDKQILPSLIEDHQAEMETVGYSG